MAHDHGAETLSNLMRRGLWKGKQLSLGPEDPGTLGYPDDIDVLRPLSPVTPALVPKVWKIYLTCFLVGSELQTLQKKKKKGNTLFF